MIKYESYGLDTVKARVREIQARMPAKIGEALQAEGENIATVSKERTPVRFGALRASTHVEPWEQSRKNVFVRIVVGGVAASYAIYVHEDLEARHTVGRAKFLDSAVMEAVPFLLSRLALRLRLATLGI